MRKVIITVLSFLAVACSSDVEDVSMEEVSKETAKEEQPSKATNKAPSIDSKTYSIAEHSKESVSIGFVDSTDEDGDEVTYTLQSTADLTVDEITGELKVGANLILDYETTKRIAFTISAFDGKTITEKDFVLTVEDVDETTLLTEDQKELIAYFQHLVFWKGANNTPLVLNQKWGSSMKLHLNGTISEEFRTTVASVISQYNALTVDSDFSISLAEDENDANAHLFFGAKEEVENFWPDMYEEIKDGNFDGFAMTPSQNSILVSTRIWISNPIEVLLKHELGHALGFGHSNKCDDEHSFLCSQISVDNDFLPNEKEIIRLMYHSQLPTGLTETEIEMVLANLILNEE